MDRKRIIKALSKLRIKPTGARTTFSVADELGRGGNGATFLVKSSKQELVAKFYVPPDSRDLDPAAFKRFEREMQLAGRMRHPYVVRAEGLGTAQVGSYQIPFYLMRRATGTLRGLVPRSFALSGLHERLRAIIRSMQGVSYLHHLGIVHRDLKPENILLFNGTPKIADLGIAHVAPSFADVSLLTLPKEQLMNRDYYAPEQRHGDATKVDHKVDIYALGCILYEVITGISPTRPNLPRLEEFHKDLAPLDNIIKRMTAHAPSRRYQDIDSALDELLWSLLHIGIPTAGPSTEDDDRKDLLRLLKSTNAANQSKAIEPAMRLGAAALPLLHEQIGNPRFDVAIAAYRILGEIGSETSVPYLTAGLYPRRTANKPNFVAGQPAALALSKYPTSVRLGVLGSLQDVVRSEDVALLVDDMAPDESFPILAKLATDKKFYEDWGEHGGLSLMLKIDENKSWPLVEEIMSGNERFYSFMVFREIYPQINALHKRQIIDYYLSRPQSLSSWDLPKILDAVTTGPFPEDYVLESINRIRQISENVIKRYAEREEFLKRLEEVRLRLLAALPGRARKRER
jgi:serine/threonine protein kinase